MDGYDGAGDMNYPPPRPRRLLIVTYHFPPSAAVAVYRMLGFAQHLPRHGWQVGFVTPPLVPREPVDEALLQRVPPVTTVFTAPYPRGWLVRNPRRLLFDAVWFPRAWPALRRAVQRFRPDAVLTSGPPHCVHSLGLWLQRRYRLPWVACLRDPWHTNGPRYKSWIPWARWERFCERRVMAAADRVIANTPITCADLQRAHPRQAHKMTFVTNGFDPERFPPPPPLRLQNERLTIVHAGEIYSGRDPRPFFDALKMLEQSRPPSQAPVRCVLLGQSTEGRFDLDAAIAQRGLQGIVEVGGQVPYAESLDAMITADILLVLDTPRRRFSIPAKVFEYLGAARPILALAEPDSDVAWCLRASGAPHRIARALDTAQILQGLTELRGGLAQGTLAHPPPEQLAKFTRARQAEILAGHLTALVSGKLAAARAARFGSALANRDALQRHPAAAPASGPRYAGA